MTVASGKSMSAAAIYGKPVIQDIFLRHWAYRQDAHDDVLDEHVDNFLKRGNLEAGFAHYKATHAGRSRCRRRVSTVASRFAPLNKTSRFPKASKLRQLRCL